MIETLDYGGKLCLTSHGPLNKAWLSANFNIGENFHCTLNHHTKCPHTKQLFKIPSPTWRGRFLWLQWINFDSLRSFDLIWRHKTVLASAQVMTFCLTVPNDYLNQYWPINSEVMWHLSECNLTGYSLNIYPWYDFENYSLKNTVAAFPKGQRV